MQPINDPVTYQRIIDSDDHYFETRVVIGDSGVLVDETGEAITFGGYEIVVSRTGPDSGFNEELVFSVETNVEMFGNQPEIGKAVSGEVNVKMFKPAGEIERMGVVIPYVRAFGHIITPATGIIVNNLIRFSDAATLISDNIVFGVESGVEVTNDIIVLPGGSEEQLVSEWIQQGEFFIDTREYTRNDDGVNILTIHGYDAMLKAEQDYWTTDMDWPEEGVLDTAIVSEIAGLMGLTVDSRTWDVMTDGYRFPLPAGYSLREVLGFIAGAYVGCFIINHTGELRLVSLTELPRETRYLVDDYGNAITFGVFAIGDEQGCRILV